MPILEVNNIGKSFGETRVLENISFTLEEGEVLSIIGSSGSGKTTLLRCLNFLETPDQGSIYVRGKKLFCSEDPQTHKEEEIRKKALAIFKVLDCYGLSRVDFFLTKDTNEVVFNEINTIPGFTAISMYPMLWEAKGITKKELVSKLLELAYVR